MAVRLEAVVQHLARTGIAPTFQAATAEGIYFENNGETWIEVKNAGAQINATIQVERSVDGLAVPDRVVVIPATTGDKIIGPFPPEYNQPGTTRVWVDFSGVTTVTVGAFDLG
jgi:RecB family endonuclease NucS